MSEQREIVASAIAAEFGRIVTDYLPSGSEHAKEAGRYASEAAARLMGLWGTPAFGESLPVVLDNILLVAAMGGHDLSAARREELRRRGEAALLMAVRIGVALALA